MTDKQRGNENAPKVDENETRSNGTDSGPRRVGDARRDHEQDRKRREGELGTSWTSVIFGAIVGASFIDQLSGIALPQVPQNAQQQIPQQGLGTILTVSGILALLVPLIGGAVGGLWGAKTGRDRP